MVVKFTPWSEPERYFNGVRPPFYLGLIIILLVPIGSQFLYLDTLRELDWYSVVNNDGRDFHPAPKPPTIEEQLNLLQIQNNQLTNQNTDLQKLVQILQSENFILKKTNNE